MPAVKKKTRAATGKARTLSEDQAFRLAASIVTRSELAYSLGQSYSGDRDIYKTLGYPTTVTPDNYHAKYERQDIAKRVIDMLPEDCWRDAPTITEEGEKETQFERDVVAMVEKHAIWEKMLRLDKLARLGEYALLLCGFDDGKQSGEPVQTGNRKLLFLEPYGDIHASISEYEENVEDERYGKPKVYNLTTKFGAKQQVLRVHYSRVVHVSEGNMESSVLGVPALQAIYNRLLNVELIAGGSAEMFWRGAFMGMAFIADKTATFGPQERSEFLEEIENYVHGLKRYMRLKGITPQPLAPQVSDPRGHMDVQLMLVCAATGTPKRKLIGSERGELASTQDDENWDDKVQGRQRNHCETKMVRPFFDLLAETGAVAPHSEDGYTVDWQDIRTPSDKDRAEVADLVAKAVKTYLDGSVDQSIPPEIFFADYLGMSHDKLDQIEMILKEREDEEERERREEGKGAMPPQSPDPVPPQLQQPPGGNGGNGDGGPPAQAVPPGPRR